MDMTVPDITFDEQGICNYCLRYEELKDQYLHTDQAGQKNLERIILDIRRLGTGKEYDCVIGVSGGVDSTYVAYLLKKRYGLRPLAVHLDNGWDTELAVNNIERILRQLDIDLITKVLNWEEFKDLQVAFLKSSIANAEIPTDHAINATLFKIAADRGLPYIITGSNIVTEAIMPGSWMYDAMDARLIRAVQRRFGTKPLRDFPLMSFWELMYYKWVKGIKTIRILDYFPYHKAEVKNLLYQELGWRDYGGKHYESIYTRFFQSYYLPRKYNIDKRKAHLSTLILSGQITREAALEEIKSPAALSAQIEDDGEYVMKKLGLRYEDFNAIMETAPKSALEYPNSSNWYRAKNTITDLARSFVRITRARFA